MTVWLQNSNAKKSIDSCFCELFLEIYEKRPEKVHFYAVRQILMTYWLLSNSLNNFLCLTGREAIKMDS